MTLSTTTVTWRGLSIGGPSSGSPYNLRDITGWDELPSYKTTQIPVGDAHGTLVAPVQFDERVVTVTGWCYNAADRDSLLAVLKQALAPLPDTRLTEPLTVSHAGQELSADARVVAVKLIPEAGWALGRFGWVAQWLCNDPLKYGGWQTVSSALAQPSAGLALPASLPAAFPDSVPGGLFSVVNDGSALAPAIYSLLGPITSPGVLLNAGTEWQQQVTYDQVLLEGDSLVISTRAGAGLINGEYRPPSGVSGLTADLVLRPGVNTVQALGTAGVADPWPSITCSFRPAYW